MKRDEQYVLRITDHAHTRYCERVEPIDRSNLIILCLRQMQDREMQHRSHDMIKLSGVWWAYECQGDMTVFVTCFGRSDFDLPKALRWAKIHDDKIRLG